MHRKIPIVGRVCTTGKCRTRDRVPYSTRGQAALRGIRGLKHGGGMWEAAMFLFFFLLFLFSFFRGGRVRIGVVMLVEARRDRYFRKKEEVGVCGMLKVSIVHTERVV